jgi:hypothetical protein
MTPKSTRISDRCFSPVGSRFSRAFMISTLALVALFSAHGQMHSESWTCSDLPPIPGSPKDIKTSMPGSEGQDLWLSYLPRSANGDSQLLGEGGLVPYDAVWLPDDPTAVTFKTDGDVFLGDLFVPGGTYSLYFLPTQRGWKLIVNKESGQRGNVYDAGQDLGTVAMTQAPAADCQVLTIDFGPIPGRECFGRCDARNGSFVPHDSFGKPLIHFAWGQANFYVVIQPPPRSHRVTTSADSPKSP